MSRKHSGEEGSTANCIGVGPPVMETSVKICAKEKLILSPSVKTAEL